MSDKKYILSIDQGTTSCRAIVFDKEGQCLGLGQEEFTQYFPKPGWVEHDAEEILAKQISCIKDAIAKAKINANEIACIGITNQRETTVVFDRKTGKSIYKAIVWQCRRTQEIADKLKEKADWYRKKTGLIPDAYFSGPKIRWILDNVPGAREKAEAGELGFSTIDSWLIYHLTGRKNHLTEPSNASRTLLFNLETLSFDDELLKDVGVPRSMMPEIISSNGNFGNCDEKLLGFSAPILANLGDQQAALFGQACFNEGMAKCTYGTGGFLLANIGSEVSHAQGLLTTVAWKLENEKPCYAFEGAIFIAGAAIQWLRDSLGIISDSKETEELAKSLQSNEGVYFVPALVGLGSPWWNSDVRGTIVGLTRGSGRNHLVRAALESIAYQVKDVALDMKKQNIQLSELRVDGGATRNLFMLQYQADLLGIPVKRATQLEATAWGVAALAGLSAGLYKDKSEIAKMWHSDITFTPSVDRSDEYTGWQKALKGAFASI